MRRATRRPPLRGRRRDTNVGVEPRQQQHRRDPASIWSLASTVDAFGDHIAVLFYGGIGTAGTW
jgi:hypothetical protein